MSTQRCPWKIRWTFGQDAQCRRDAHVHDTGTEPTADGRFRSYYRGDPHHEALLPNGITTLHWQTGDRREYRGDLPGNCTVTPGCTLPAGHHGRCAP